MRNVKLIWKTNVTKKSRAAVMRWIKEHYPSAKDVGPVVEFKASNRDTRYIWIFMFSHTFSNLQ